MQKCVRKKVGFFVTHSAFCVRHFCVGYNRRMALYVAVRLSLSALRRNLTRTSLTMLGVVIGVAAVIAIVALGVGAKEAIEDRITSAGANMIVVRAGNRTIGGVRLGMGASSRLTAADAGALRQLVGVKHVSPGLRTRQQVVGNGENWSTSIEGCGAEMLHIRSWLLKHGAFFTDQDVRDAAKVAVLGSTVHDMLFGAGRGCHRPDGARGDRAVPRHRHAREPRETRIGGMDQDDTIFVPFTTVQKRLMGDTYLDASRSARGRKTTSIVW